MSLVAWYPLNGNLKDKGILGNDLINNGAIVSDEGKIGKCYEFTSSSHYMETTKEINASNQISLCAWINVSDTVSANEPLPIISIFNNNVNGVLFCLRFLNNKWCPNITYYNGNVTSDYNIQGNPITYNSWVHIAAIIDFQENNFSIYLNGEYYGKKTKTDTISPMINTKLYLNQYGSNYFSRNYRGYMNDIRIYDHILSKAEIKEIYKTPILKYSFNYPVIDPNISTQTNIDFSSILTGGENKSKQIGIIKYDNTYIVDNNYFTISYDVTIQDLTFKEGNTGLFRVMSYNILADGTVSYSNFISSSDKNGKGFLIGASDGSGEINLTQNGTYHIVRCYQLTNTASMINDWDINARVDYITGGTLKIENLRVVLGTKEILYDGTGNVFYDETGLGNDGVLVGQDTFLPTSYSTESKIGEGCYVSKTKTDLGESTYGIIKCDNFTEVPEISVCFWTYVPETDKNTEDNTFLGYSANKNNWGIFIRRYGLTLKATMYGANLNTEDVFERGMWHYVVVTAQKVGNINIYINGELKASGVIPSGVDWEKAILTIGDLRENRKLGFDGKIDDLIIYATALSENDIKKQYRDVAKIDSDGNLYCKKIDENIRKVEYLESSGSQFIDTGIIPTENTRFYIKASTNGIPQHTGLFGSRTNGLASFLSYIENSYGGDTNTIRVDLQNITGNTGKKWTENEVFTIDINCPNKKLLINDEIISRYNSMSFTAISEVTIGLFANHDGNNYIYPISGKIYYCKIWDNDALVRDFIPIISTEKGHIGEACLFDSVTNTYFYNQGTGKFTTNLDENTIDTNFTGKGIVNTNYFIEGKDIVKVINNENIIETNKIYEN